MLNEQIVGRLPVALPPLPEQRATFEYLGESLERVHHLAEGVAGGIERLQEHRTALVTAAVTGKIDVRELATAAGSPAE